MIKKLLILPLIALLLAPALPAHALSMLSDPTGELIDNIENAESVDFNMDLDFETKSENMEYPVSIHVDYDGVWDTQDTGSFDLAFLTSDQYGESHESEGSIVLTPDRVYFSETDDEWYFIEQTVSTLVSDENRDLELTPTDLFAEEDSWQGLDNFETFMQTMFEHGVIEYDTEAAEFIDGTLAVRYAYELNGDNLADYLVEYAYITEQEAVGMRTFLNENITVSGNFWIDTVEMLPVMFTLNIASNPSEMSYTTFEFSVVFNSFNESVDVDAPEDAIDFDNYESGDTQDLIMSSFSDTVVNIDTDGDGVTDEEEVTVWDSNIFDSDSDGDGYDDNTEIDNGYNPNGIGLLDSDGDGLTDRDEMTIHWSDRFNADTDGDGYDDGLEIANGYDPNGPGRW